MDAAHSKTLPQNYLSHDERVTAALRVHGARLQQTFIREFGGNGEDLYQEVTLTLFTSDSESVTEILESNNYTRLESWFTRVARNRTWNQEHRRPQQNFETHTHADAELDNYVCSNDSLLQLAEDLPPLLETLKQLGNPRVIQAYILRAENNSWSEVARLAGFGSKQAAQKACTSKLVTQQLAFAWRALRENDLCPEIANDLAFCAWTLEDLDPEIRSRVDEHLMTCPMCASIMDTHHNTLKAAAAFFPIPLLAANAHEGFIAPLTTAWDYLNAKLHNTIAFFTSQSASTTWSAPKTAAAAATGVLILGGGGAAVHKSLSNPKPKATPAATGLASPTFYGPVKLPAVKTTKAKKKRKSRASSPTQQQPAPPAQSQPAPKPQAPQAVDDGSAEFLPESR